MVHGRERKKMKMSSSSSVIPSLDHPHPRCNVFMDACMYVVFIGKRNDDNVLADWERSKPGY